MLQQPFFSFKIVKRLFDEVLEFYVVEVAQGGTRYLLDVFHFFNKRRAHERSEVEVEGRNGLAAVHFVLGGFQRYAADNRCRFNALRGARFAVAGNESVFQNAVKRMLDACE